MKDDIVRVQVTLRPNFSRPEQSSDSLSSDSDDDMNDERLPIRDGVDCRDNEDVIGRLFQCEESELKSKASICRQKSFSSNQSAPQNETNLDWTEEEDLAIWSRFSPTQHQELCDAQIAGNTTFIRQSIAKANLGSMKSSRHLVELIQRAFQLVRDKAYNQKKKVVV